MAASRVLIDQDGRPMLASPDPARGGAAQVQTEQCQDPKCGCKTGCCTACDTRGICIPLSAPPCVQYEFEVKIASSLWTLGTTTTELLEDQHEWTTTRRFRPACGTTCGRRITANNFDGPPSSQGMLTMVAQSASMLAICDPAQQPTAWPHLDFRTYGTSCPPTIEHNYKGVPTNSAFWSRPSVLSQMSLSLSWIRNRLIGVHSSAANAPTLEVGAIVRGTSAPVITAGIKTGAVCPTGAPGYGPVTYDTDRAEVEIVPTSLGQRCISRVKASFAVDMAFTLNLDPTKRYATRWMADIEIGFNGVGVCGESAGDAGRASGHQAPGGIPSAMLPENAFGCTGCGG